MQHQNINRHMKTAHSKTLQYSAICYEQMTGLVMVRKSQMGAINYPCHVQKIINDGMWSCHLPQGDANCCKLTGKLACRCGARKYICLHKALCWWYLYQVGKIKNLGDQQTEDIAALDDPEVDISFENITNNSFAIYPLDSQTALLRMIEYMQNTKKLPNTEPQKYVKISSDIVHTAFIPSEIMCHQCYEPLSPPHRITYQAKDYSNGIHNYNDIFLIGLHVCQYMRECLKNHVAVGTVCKIFSGTLQVHWDQATVVNAYAHFEALS
eukprot:gene2052-2328_t